LPFCAEKFCRSGAYDFVKSLNSITPQLSFNSFFDKPGVSPVKQTKKER